MNTKIIFNIKSVLSERSIENLCEVVNTALHLPNKVELGWGMVLHIYISVPSLVYDEGRVLHVWVFFVVSNVEYSSPLVERTEASSSSFSAIAKLGAMVRAHKVVVAIRAYREPPHFVKAFSCGE